MAQFKTKPLSIAKSTAHMGVATLLSRATGFIRTWALAFALGNSALASAYNMANNLPTMISELVAGGMLAAAFLPIYLSLKHSQDDNSAKIYTSQMLSWIILGLGALAILMGLFAPQVVLTQSFLTANSATIEPAIFFFRIFAVQIAFYGISGVISGYLNAERSFLWPALGPLFNNIICIVVLIAYPFIAGSVGFDLANLILALGTSLGVAALFIVQIPELLKHKLNFRFSLKMPTANIRHTFKLAAPAMFFVLINLVYISLQNAFALLVSDSGPAAVGYAWLFAQLPNGIIAVSVTTAYFTELSSAHSSENMAAFKTHIRSGLRLIIILILPIVLIMAALSTQLTGLLRVGNFTAGDMDSVSTLMQIWLLSMPFNVIYLFLYKVFAARHQLIRFTILCALALIPRLFFYALFTGQLLGAINLGLLALPVTDITIFTLLMISAMALLFSQIGTYGIRNTSLLFLQVLVISLAAAVLPYLGSLYLPEVLSAIGLSSIIGQSILLLIVLGALGVAIFVCLSKLIRLPEIDAAINKVKNLLFHRHS